MNILQIVEESPSLDFSLPFLQFTDDDSKVLVFSTKPSYKHWYEDTPDNLIFRDKNITFFTTLDTMNAPRIVKKILYKFTKKNRSNTDNFFEKVLRKICTAVINVFSKPNIFINEYFSGNPDVVLIETRNDLIPNKVNKDLFNWINKNNIKCIGIPNSAYTLESVKWSPITPFGKHNIKAAPFYKFPNNYEYWMTSSQPYVIEQLKEVPYRIVGYPGADTNWINLFRFDENRNIDSKEINLLLNIRHFGKNRNLGFGIGQYNIDDIKLFFNILKECIERENQIKFNLYIKPHYYVNFSDFEKILKDLEIKNFEFLKTSIYKALNNIDIVIGLHTSVNLISALSGYPTLLFPQVLTDNIKKDDIKTKNMYEGMRGYSENKDEFKEKFRFLLNNKNRIDFSKKDREHLREFFDDKSIENILSYLN
tara:strand:+ start:6764 stop:8032 length:1269 start_codon:yes stop_codon:yes gene_type:complete